MSTVLNHTTQPLAGQLVVITGAGLGIGAAIAHELSSMGAAAVLCGRTRAALESCARAIAQAGGKAEVALCDVTNLQSVEAVAERVEASFGALTSWLITPASEDSEDHSTNSRPSRGRRFSTRISGVSFIRLALSRR
jgi:NAD(P)-dependent dehydrogenase (short-subunit alcohol dehydrogenase family)